MKFWPPRHPEPQQPQAPAPQPASAPASDSASEADESAASFEVIVERYHDKVFALAYRYTGDYHAACDLTQDTFVRAFGAWNEFRGDSQVFTWLYRITLNLCHNHQKKTRRRNSSEMQVVDAPGEDGSSEAFPLPDVRALPAQLVESSEMRLRLQAALRELPENYRTVVVLRDIEGLSYEEIARITDSSLEAIKSRLFRARNMIRRLLEPYMNEPLSPFEALQPDLSGKRPRMKRS